MNFCNTLLNWLLLSIYQNQVLSTKQYLERAGPKGAHLLLQMRTRVLNGELEQTFREWHLGFRAANDEKLKKVA